MKCKECGSELFPGAGKCPYCGAKTKPPVRKASEAFNWSEASDLGDRRKKKDISIDWSAGKIFDRSSGQVYSQSSNCWSEPEDVKNLFSFDQKNEEFQEILDRQMESIEESVPDYTPSSGRMFDLPSTMDMGVFDSLINDNVDVSLVDKNGEEHSIAELRGTAPKKTQEPEEAKAPEMVWTEPEQVPEKERIFSGGIFAGERPAGRVNIFDTDDTALESGDDVPEPPARSSYTKEEEDRVYNGLRKLMDAEEKFKDDLDRVAFLTPEEKEQAEKIEQKSQKLTFVPTVSFRTLEDEYADYCDENGIEPPEPLVIPERKKPEQIEKTEKNDSPNLISEAAGFLNRYRSRNADRDKKGVEIKINEPSGTRVTVKTQEFHLAGEEGEKSAQTREVNMEEVVSTPKNVQVSVEVSAAQGNASVEVTRRHDGATVVRTVDHSNQEHMYVDDEESKRAAEEAAAAAADTEEEVDPASFWERSDQATRMTITDIFGPEARKILDQIDRKRENEEAASKKDLEDSLILDINPDDIRLTPAQTMALHTVSFDVPPEYRLKEDGEMQEVFIGEELPARKTAPVSLPEEEAPDVSAEQESQAEVQEEESEPSPSDEETAAPEEAAVPEEAPAEEKEEPQEAPVSEAEEVPEISSPQAAEEPAQEEKAAPEPEAPSEPQNEDRLAEEKTIEVSAPVAAAAERKTITIPIVPAEALQAEEPQAEGKAPQQEADVSAAEAKIQEKYQRQKDKVQTKAEKALEKEVARQKKQAEKAQKKLLKENEPESGKMSGVIRAMIIVLALALIAEFTIFGIKLFASDSQAAVFIYKVEESISGLFHGNDSSKPADGVPSDTGGSAEPSGGGDTGDPAQGLNG